MPTPQNNSGFDSDDLAMNAIAAQRTGTLRPGDYICQKCQTHFNFGAADDQKLQCPKCQNTKSDSLTPFYTEEDPSRDEMLGKNEFTAGD